MIIDWEVKIMKKNKRKFWISFWVWVLTAVMVLGSVPTIIALLMH